MNFEIDYAALIMKILTKGEVRETRNARTKAIFGESLVVDMSDTDQFPLLLGRKMFYKGVFGELAAILKGPKNVKDFEEMGCNYWKLWADSESGRLDIDYGNSWIDYNGVNQLSTLIETLRNNPTDRRMMITGWRPDRLEELSLPCCHHTYQWFVREGRYLDMIWMQRSVDTMIGLPSDIILAALWNTLIANEVGLQPGRIKMDLGDTHIYEPHWEQAKEYYSRVLLNLRWDKLDYPKLWLPREASCSNFDPKDVVMIDYEPLEAMKFELLA